MANDPNCDTNASFGVREALCSKGWQPMKLLRMKSEGSSLYLSAYL